MANNAKIICLLADVHLMPDSQHPINQKFLSFLHNQAQEAQEIYLLGDLFETWTGDDIGLEDYATEIAELKKLADKGIKTYLCYGNRDFLMRQDFWQATGIEQLEDITYKNLLGHNCILMHGDQLCTLDTGYQKMRKIFRNKLIQNIFLLLPKLTRRKIAGKLRNKRNLNGQGWNPAPTSVGKDHRVIPQKLQTNNESNVGNGFHPVPQKNINPKYDVNPAEVERTFLNFKNNAINKKLWSKVGLSHPLSCTDSTAMDEMTQDCPEFAVNLIHGHTHLPAYHPYPHNYHRWTVSDWDNTPQIIQITPEEIQLIKL